MPWLTGKLAGIVAVVALLLGTVSGYLYADARRLAEIEGIKRAYAEEKQRVQADAMRRLEVATQRGKEAASKLLAAESNLRKSREALRHAKAKYTTGRNCLSANAVRMLNNAGRASSDTASSAAAKDASRFATDQDLWNWSENARHSYQICARRLNALIDYLEKEVR